MVPEEAVEPGHAKATIDASVVVDVAPLDESLHPGGSESNIRGMNLASINDWLFFVHAAMTLFMVGAIRFVQIVHYPLFTTSARRVIHAPGSIVPRTSEFDRLPERILSVLRETPQDTRAISTENGFAKKQTLIK